MAHLHGIGFENFRVFRNNTYFDFAPLTILTGTNSSGKSSVINGIKLLSESFKDINKPNIFEGKILHFDALLRETLDVTKIIERYGNLNQFLNNNSQKNEFTFSFIKSIPVLNDDLEIIYTVGIEENRLKTGRIRNIEMKSRGEKKTIFKAYETITKVRDVPDYVPVNHHAFKIDLSYFILKYNSHISENQSYYQSKVRLIQKLKEEGQSESLEEAIKNHNLKFGDHCTIEEYEDENGKAYGIFDPAGPPSFVIDDLEKVKGLLDEYKSGFLPFDFSFLWKEDPLVFTDYIQIVDSYFGQDPHKEILFQKELLKVLSSVEWKIPVFDGPYIEDFPSVDVYIRFPKKDDPDNASPFSLKEFINSKVFRNAYFFSLSPDEIESYIQDSINNSGLERNKFTDEVFVPLLRLIIKVYKRELGGNGRNDNYPLSVTEKYFYNEFVFNTLSCIAGPLRWIKRFSFIDAQRVQPKRVFSINHTDLFSKQIKNLFELPDEPYNYCMNFLNRWLKEFNIADKIDLKKDDDTENFKVYLIKSGEKPVLLADYGFGTSQVLPIIIAMIPEMNPNFFDPYEHQYLPKFVCIEEPENSLHPALQSKLGEMFAEAITKFNVQLIIETHSEYLIRKLQYLTAVKKHEFKLDSASTQIYYFNHPGRIPEGEEQVRKISIKSDGFLSEEFGEGFFDESGRLMIDLLKLQNQN